MARIFISYRRSDDAGSVGRLRDRLRATYGADAIFRDIDGIPRGARFADVIGEELRRSQVLLVAIGPNWVSATATDGAPRLFDPDDWVRQEVEMGLARDDLRIVPVLVGGAPLPTRDQLPESMHGLLDFNAAVLEDDSFDADFDALVRDLGGMDARTKRLIPIVAALGVVLLGVVGYFLIAGGDDDREQADGDEAASVPPDVGSDGTAPTTPPPPPMDGRFNVGVAEFVDTSPQADRTRSAAPSFSGVLANDLEVAFDDSSVQVRGPDAIGTVGGADTTEQSLRARDLAAVHGADLLIHGSLDPSGPVTLSPTIYLSGRTLAGYVELQGPYPLGAIESAGSLTNDVTRDQINESLARNAVSLRWFARGLGAYELLADDGRAEEATEYFENALAEAGDDGLVVAPANVFLGSLALQRDEYDVARAHFDRALAADDNAERAMLGRAEVILALQRSSLCAEGTVSSPELADARSSLEDARLIADTRAELSDNPNAGTLVKTELGLARAARCELQSGLATDSEAVVSQLEAVIEVADGDEELDEIGAIARAELALAVAPSVGVDDGAAIERSLELTLEAVDRTQLARNRAAFLFQAAFYHQQLGQAEDAQQALQEAADELRAVDADAADVLLGIDPGTLGSQATGRLVPSVDGTPERIRLLVEPPTALATTGASPALAVVGLTMIALGLVLVRGASARRTDV